MERNDLRIGNYVTEEGRLILIHDGFGIDHAHNFEPIEITEEWLVKFGFITMDLEIDYVEWGREDTGHIFILVSNGMREMTPVFYERKDSEMDRMEVKCIHKLQNLYLALTGEELILKD